ncbi:MAG: hypothetical protein IIC78_04350 [Chloroflexi bacterium]|nr:hypothetical protein [Chloroflexota bacterium]
MVELYLLSLFGALLTDYGLQSRKQAAEKFAAGWRWKGSFTRLVIWGAVFFWWLARVQRSWPGFLIVSILGFLTGEIGTYALRRSVRANIAGSFPLTKPQTHLIPFFAAIVPAVAGGLYLNTFASVPFAPLIILRRPALIYATAFIALFCWSTTITVSVVGLIRSGQISEEIEPYLGAGEVIGILERLLTFVFILNGGLAAVGFTVAAKAAARFPKFKDSAFAEYFLIGTLTSVGLATIIGLAVAAIR